MASASLPHQGRFAPLRGAREERASLTRQPVRHPVKLQGRDEEQGFSGPNKEQGLKEEGAFIPSRSYALSAGLQVEPSQTVGIHQAKAASPQRNWPPISDTDYPSLGSVPLILPQPLKTIDNF